MAAIPPHKDATDVTITPQLKQLAAHMNGFAVNPVLANAYLYV
jgi:hypothetical protein